MSDGRCIALLRAVLSVDPGHRLWSDLPALLGKLGEGDLDDGPLLRRLDTGEQFSSVAASARVALSLYDAHEEWAVGIADLEQDQARDAALRARSLGALAWRLFDGDATARAQAMRAHPAGAALLAWFSAVDVALAFTNLGELPSEHRPSDLSFVWGDAANEHLAAVLDAETCAGAAAVLAALLPELDAAASAASEQVSALADAVRANLAPAANDRDSLAAEAANLPVYQLLSTALVRDVRGAPDPVAEAEAAAKREIEAARRAAAEEKRQAAIRLAATEAARLEAERAGGSGTSPADDRREAERLEAERREKARIEAERIEAERIEAARLEAERIEAQRLEANRLEANRLEANRLEAERLEAERLEAERLEAERLEAERLEAQRLEAERLEAQRLEADRRRTDREALLSSLTTARSRADTIAAELAPLTAQNIPSPNRTTTSLDALNAERGALAASAQSLDAQRASLTESIDAARDALATSAAALDAQNTTLTRLESALADLTSSQVDAQQQLAELTQHADDACKTHEAEAAALTKAQADLADHQRAIGETRAAIADLDRAAQTANATARQAAEQAIADASAQTNATMAEQTRAEAALHELHQRRAALDGRAAQQASTSADLIADQLAQRATYEAASDASDALRDRIASLREEIDAAPAESPEITALRESLGQAQQALQTETRDASDATEALATATGESKTAAAEIDALQSAATATKAAAAAAATAAARAAAEAEAQARAAAEAGVAAEARAASLSAASRRLHDALTTATDRRESSFELLNTANGSLGAIAPARSLLAQRAAALQADRASLATDRQDTANKLDLLRTSHLDLTSHRSALDAANADLFQTEQRAAADALALEAAQNAASAEAAQQPAAAETLLNSQSEAAGLHQAVLAAAQAQAEAQAALATLDQRRAAAESERLAALRATARGQLSVPLDEARARRDLAHAAMQQNQQRREELRSDRALLSTQKAENTANRPRMVAARPKMMQAVGQARVARDRALKKRDERSRPAATAEENYARVEPKLQGIEEALSLAQTARATLEGELSEARTARMQASAEQNACNAELSASRLGVEAARHAVAEGARRIAEITARRAAEARARAAVRSRALIAVDTARDRRHAVESSLRATEKGLDSNKQAREAAISRAAAVKTEQQELSKLREATGPARDQTAKARNQSFTDLPTRASAVTEGQRQVGLAESALRGEQAALEAGRQRVSEAAAGLNEAGLTLRQAESSDALPPLRAAQRQVAETRALLAAQLTAIRAAERLVHQAARTECNGRRAALRATIQGVMGEARTTADRKHVLSQRISARTATREELRAARAPTVEGIGQARDALEAAELSRTLLVEARDEAADQVRAAITLVDELRAAIGDGPAEISRSTAELDTARAELKAAQADTGPAMDASMDAELAHAAAAAELDAWLLANDKKRQRAEERERVHQLLAVAAGRREEALDAKEDAESRLPGRQQDRAQIKSEQEALAVKDSQQRRVANALSRDITNASALVDKARARVVAARARVADHNNDAQAPVREVETALAEAKADLVGLQREINQGKGSVEQGRRDREQALQSLSKLRATVNEARAALYKLGPAPPKPVVVEPEPEHRAAPVGGPRRAPSARTPPSARSWVNTDDDDDAPPFPVEEDAPPFPVVQDSPEDPGQPVLGRRRAPARLTPDQILARLRETVARADSAPELPPRVPPPVPPPPVTPPPAPPPPEPGDDNFPRWQRRAAPSSEGAPRWQPPAREERDAPSAEESPEEKAARLRRWLRPDKSDKS